MYTLHLEGRHIISLCFCHLPKLNAQQNADVPLMFEKMTGECLHNMICYCMIFSIHCSVRMIFLYLFLMV